LVVLALDFGKGRLEAIPLCLILLAALGDGEGVDEFALVFPQL
jgi:hypothetical protein